MGSIFDRVTTVEEELDPWAPTVDPLTDHIAMVGNQNPWTSYQGDWVSDFNQNQTDALAGSAGFGLGGMQTYGDQLMSTGAGLLDNYGKADDFYTGAMGWNPIIQGGPDLEMVSQMADNPYVTDMIDAVSRDVTRNLYEEQMPGIAAASAGAGQTGSSRRGGYEAIAERGTADRLADISGTIRGSLWDTGLANEVARNANNAELAYNNRGQQLDAAGNLVNLGGYGVDMLNSGADMKNTGFSNALASGDREQEQAQLELDALMAQHYQDQQLPYDQAAMGINTVLEPAWRFGENNTTETEEWDGALDVLTALLTGGGTTINNLVSGGAGGAGGAGGSAAANASAGGESGGGFGDLIGDVLGDVFGGGGDVIEEFPQGGGTGVEDLIKILTGGGDYGTPPIVDDGNGNRGNPNIDVGELIRVLTGAGGSSNSTSSSGTQGNADVIQDGATVASSTNNDPSSVLDQTIASSGATTSTPDNTAVNQGDQTLQQTPTQRVQELLAAGLPIEEVIKIITAESGASTGDVGVQGGTATSQPDLEVAGGAGPIYGPEAPTQADLDAAVKDAGLTDAEIAAIQAAQNDDGSIRTGDIQGGLINADPGDLNLPDGRTPFIESNNQTTQDILNGLPADILKQITAPGEYWGGDVDRSAQDPSGIVSGGFAGGNIQDGEYTDPTQTPSYGLGNLNIQGIIDNISGIPNVSDGKIMQDLSSTGIPTDMGAISQKVGEIMDENPDMDVIDPDTGEVNQEDIREIMRSIGINPSQMAEMASRITGLIYAATGNQVPDGLPAGYTFGGRGPSLGGGPTPVTGIIEL